MTFKDGLAMVRGPGDVGMFGVGDKAGAAILMCRFRGYLLEENRGVLDGGRGRTHLS